MKIPGGLKAGRAAAGVLAGLLCVGPVFAAEPVAEPLPTAQAAAASAQDSVAIRLPVNKQAVFKVLFNYDKVQSAGGSTLYPAYGLAGFIAAVVTHGVIVETVKDAQRQQAEAAADALLLPYRAFLEQLTHEALMRQALDTARLPGTAQLVDANTPSEAEWMIELAPIFWLTQDQRAIVLDLAATVSRGHPRSQVWQERLRVVSSPLVDPADPLTQWTTDEARGLKTTSAALLGMAYELVLSQARRTVGAPAGEEKHKTIRFHEGARQRIERAVLVRQDDCAARALIKTLRGDLMYVPLVAEPAADCNKG